MTPSPTPVTTTTTVSSPPAASSTHNIWATLLKFLEVVAIVAPAAAAPFETTQTAQVVNTESAIAQGVLGALTGTGSAQSGSTTSTN